MARRPQAWASADALLELDEGYAQVLSLLDRRTAFRAILDRLPGDIGVDVAWIGEVDPSGDIVLGHAVRTRTDAVDGLVVPPGVGLGGLVMQTGRPAWVADYPSASDLSRQFSRQAEREGVRGMIAVPLVHGGRPLGVLYAADRAETHYGDLAVTALQAAAARAANAAVVAERARHSAEVAVLEERRRLAMQLHDTVGAMLFTIGAGVRSLGDDLARQPDLQARLETIERQAAEAAAVFRESLDALHAPPEAVALAVALRADSRGFEERTGIPTRLLVLDDLPPLHASRSSALASAVREALLNVEKHARAGSVLVSVFASRAGVAVAVHDDGVGPPPDGADGGGLGLAAATERLERVGGHLTMGRNDDGGVTVQAWVPE
ncbi:MAG TPA: GAF domain-containing protein [Acidimicrobiales bacterium]|nr:GAF domain-containing protein [Acidimicrobiales bacterium]